ncbi:MAG: flavodoxin family protein [Clostridia bacterium]|nr:flavodoxin family protein [Clostridia bacterium]
MSKIVILKASPRKNGNSNALAAAFAEEAKKAGASITEYDVANMEIAGCRGCYGCMTKGACVFHDDFKKIAEDLHDADVIVIASPVYWYTFPAQIKAVIDRWFSLCVTGKDFSGKKAALLSCCEEETKETFAGIRFSFEKTMALMKAEIVGEVLIPSVSDAGEIKNTNGEEQARELARKFF